MRLHVITLLGLSAPLLTSCGSSWDIRKGDKLEIGCAESFFYADGDGDGWGDPASDPQKLCSADVDAGLTASNGRDCDDADATLTGLVGTLCPDGLAGAAVGGFAPHGGVIFGDYEFAWVYGGEAPVARHGASILSCEGWGGALRDGDNWISQGSLATFGGQAELEAARDTIEASVSGDMVYAAFIGVHWDGPSLDSGQWSWVDDSNDALITQGFSWCDGVEPAPEDFFPLLNPNDPNHVPAINAQLPELRLAWVLQDTGQWCLGLPWHAIPDDVWADLQAGTADMGDPFVANVSRYTPSDAHVLCKRAKPDPANYRHLVGADEG